MRLINKAVKFEENTSRVICQKCEDKNPGHEDNIHEDMKAFRKHDWIAHKIIAKTAMALIASTSIAVPLAIPSSTPHPAHHHHSAATTTTTTTTTTSPSTTTTTTHPGTTTTTVPKRHGTSPTTTTTNPPTTSTTTTTIPGTTTTTTTVPPTTTTTTSTTTTTTTIPVPPLKVTNPTVSGGESAGTPGTTFTINGGTISGGNAPYSIEWLVALPNTSATVAATKANSPNGYCQDDTASICEFVTSKSAPTGGWQVFEQITDGAGTTVVSAGNVIFLNAGAPAPSTTTSTTAGTQQLAEDLVMALAILIR